MYNLFKKQYNKIQIKNRYSGFTLIEILVASAIFVVLITTTMATFGASSSLQTKSEAIQASSQSSRFILESIVRDIRLADKFNLTNYNPANITIYSGTEEISYIYKPNEKSIYYVDSFGETKLNSNNTEVTEFKISGIDYNFIDIQSFIKIEISFKGIIGKGFKSIETHEETINTTITTRNYDKAYIKITE